MAVASMTLLSFWPGLKGHAFTPSSQIETIILGILGFFLTVVRLVSVAVVGAYFGPGIALVYHDFFAASLLTFIWLFGFWWFSYRFILEERLVMVGEGMDRSVLDGGKCRG